MQMNHEDERMLEGSLNIMRNMYVDLRALPVEDASKDISEFDEKTRKLYSRKDQKDTVYFDMVAENAISLGTEDGHYGHYSLFQRVYNQSGMIITEERGKVPSDIRIEHNTPVIISDPVDRSSYLEDIVKRHAGYGTMGEILDAEAKSIGGKHARVEACNSSVTLLKDNTIKYSVVLNLFTGEAFVAYEPGVFYGDIEELQGLGDLKRRASFKDIETDSMLCYTRDGKYENNREGTHLRFFDLDRSIESPGGPNRFTYLLNETKGKPVSGIGVIAHNGEKIQESLPDIAMAYFSNVQLRAYKLFCDREYHESRAGKVLTPNLQNSLYNHGLIANTGIKLTFLNNHEYPSEFRDTTVIFPTVNEKALTMMEGMVSRDFAIRIV
jgi:hypothetical protein